MRKVKILIVEDQVIVAKDIAHYLTKMGCEVIGILIEGEEVLPFVKNEKPDIILMDIALKGAQDGISTVHLLQKSDDIPIIYLTANTDDRSFELAKATKPFAFVEKPFKPKKLIRTVELLIEQIAENISGDNARDDDQIVLNDRVFVRSKGKMVKIMLADIRYIEADGAYSNIVASDQRHLLALNLRKIEEKISNKHLVRIHRSYVINLNHIDSIEENHIDIGGKSIPIGRTYKEAFLKQVKLI